MAILLGVLAGAFVLFYVVPLLLGALLLRFGPAVTPPTMAAVDQAWLEQRWLDGARESLGQLQELGFVHRLWLDGLAPRTAPMGVRCVAVLVNDATGDVAQVAVMDRPDDEGGVELATVPIFTRVAGDKRVITSNSDSPGVHRYPPEYAVHAFPMLRSLLTLYSAHRAVCARHLGDGVAGQTLPRGQEVANINRECATEFAYQAERGLLRLTDDGRYARTWYGALDGVWRLHPRFIGWQRRRVHARALRTLKELGITPDPVPAKAPPPPAKAELSPEMQAFLQSACEEYMAATEQLQREWHLHQATRFDADLTAGVVRFHFADGRVVAGDAQILGTWSRPARSWEWAWNNPNIDAAAKPDGERLREFGRTSGISYLDAGFVPAPNVEVGAYLAAIGAKVVGATAVIPLPPDGDADVVAFAALRNLRVTQTTAA